MKNRSPFVLSLAVLLSLALVIPPDIASQAGQRAGQVSRLIPAVSLQRGAQRLAAAEQTPVFWEDVVNTQRNARARIALDDGSLLNVGAESSLRVSKHDPGAQQTQLELTYGRVRSRAVRLARPDGKFEVRTPAGVAGVVGTDFYLAFLSGLLQLIVFEGIVRFCNLQGQCVEVGAGQTSTIRNSQSPPDPPVLATALQLTEAARSTDIQEPTDAAPHHLKAWQIIGLIILAAAPAVAVPLATRRQPAAPARKPCVPNPNTGLCP
jgi:hypothetical protein